MSCERCPAESLVGARVCRYCGERFAPAVDGWLIVLVVAVAVGLVAFGSCLAIVQPI